jgi:hypothetical protein
MKKLFIDITPMRSTLHKEWDGEKPKRFTTYVKQNKDRMINFINEHIPAELEPQYTLDIVQWRIIVTMEHATKLDAFLVTDKLVQRDLFSYVR